MAAEKIIDKVLLTGASGFIGSSLSRFLQAQGYLVTALPRDMWNMPFFEGFDIFIHLAGEPLSLTRWSSEKKRKILESREKSTKALLEIIRKLSHKPKLFLSASAVGFYGDRGEEALTEESPKGTGFLSDVCLAWEQAHIQIPNVRRALTRFGIVLGPNGGALQKMLLPYKLGLGGPLGSGEQWQSWIALQDLLRGILHVIQTEALSGPINFVSPHPVRQKEFAHTLAHLLHRPAFLKVPTPFVRLLFGDVADLMLLASAKVVPSKLLQSGFHFDVAELEAALKAARF